ncbi:hypothetical protein [Paraburkholderia sp. BCC1884]|nr:hypothetical protein [Paraburkholderia sp. BCC1884]
MPNLIDYIIENRSLRDRFINFLYPFMLIGTVVSSTCMFLARHYR